MLRLLSWTGCDKANTPEMRMFVSNQDSPGSGAIAMSSPRKRKHSDEPSSQPDKKRAKPAERKNGKSALATVTPTRPTPAGAQIPKPSTTTPEPASSLPSTPDVKLEGCEVDPKPTDSLVTGTGAQRLQSVRNVIQTQIGLEILLKHKELRLIDQEIAKCQASLEQLRRCKEIPYPGAQQLSMAVSEGSGLALRSAFPTPLPHSPAPWGVTDGPYSRHYAKWLLPDSRFDGGEPEPLSAVSAGKTPSKSRSTRGSFEMPSVSTSARSSRGGKLKALPAGYGQPKEKATGPMIVKRKSDGLSVKLVCPDCGRHDFGSAQGFINHCRIGHGRSFASHDAAADACGEPVEVDESGAMVGAEPVATPTAANVHPLIRSAKLLQPTPPKTSTQLSGITSNKAASGTKLKNVSPDFRGSVLTPNLSDLIKNRGLGLDLQEMVTDAKTKVELPDSDSEDDDMDIEVPMQDTAKGRHPQVAGTKQPSNKSPMSSPLLSSHMLRSSATPRRGLPQYDGADDTPIPNRPRGMTLPMTQPTMTDLQPSDPSPISESNQAPSLVDDDEEYEAHSPTSSSVSDEHDVGEIEFEIQGDEDDARSSVLRGPEFQPSCAQTARPSTHVRRPSAIRRQGEDREEKHVSFVSPSPAREMQTSRQSGDRKKRKA